MLNEKNKNKNKNKNDEENYRLPLYQLDPKLSLCIVSHSDIYFVVFEPIL